MQIPKLQQNKIKQLIKRHGVQYQFERAKKDDFNQPVLDDDGNPVMQTEVEVSGVFHETGSNFVLITTDSAKVQSKPSPAIITMMEYATGLKIDDQLTVPPGSIKRYKVVSVNDLGNVGLFADISLELIADGTEV